MAESSVVQMREAIATEYDAMQRGMFAFREGVARHQFISRSYSAVVEKYEPALVQEVGETEAKKILYETYAHWADTNLET